MKRLAAAGVLALVALGDWAAWWHLAEPGGLVARAITSFRGPILPAGFASGNGRIEATEYDVAARRWLRPSTQGGWKVDVPSAPAQRLELVQTLETALGNGHGDPALHAMLREDRRRTGRALQCAGQLGRLKETLRSLKQRLYPYQREAVERFLSTGRLLLADDMGLGKTAQAIAACHALWHSGSSSSLDTSRLKPSGTSRAASLSCSRSPRLPDSIESAVNSDGSSRPSTAAARSWISASTAQAISVVMFPPRAGWLRTSSAVTLCELIHAQVPEAIEVAVQEELAAALGAARTGRRPRGPASG